MYERGQNEEDDDDDDDEDDDEDEVVVVENNNNNNNNEAFGNFVDLNSMINDNALITNNDENVSQESVIDSLPEPMDESNDKSNKIYHKISRNNPCFTQLIIFLRTI